MKRRFLSNLAFLLFVNLLVKPFWILGIDRTVQNQLGASEYGFYFALLNFSFLYSMVLDFGISNFNNRAIARNEGLISRFAPNFFAIKILLGFGYWLLSAATAWLIGFDGPQFQLLWWLLLNQFFISFTLYLRSNVAAKQLFRLDALLSVTDRLLMIAIIGAMLWGQWEGFQFSLKWFVYGQTAAYAGTTALALVAVVSRSTLQVRLDAGMVRRLLAMSAPYALLGILMTVYNRIDSVMLERMLGDEGNREAGIYAASYRLLDASNMIGFAFASILLPLFARMIKQGVDFVPQLQQSYRLLLSVSLPVAAAAWWFRLPVMDLLYTDADPYWADIFGWLLLSFPAVATMYVYGSLLTAAGKMKHLNLLAAAGVVLNIVLNLLLIPHHQALGATIATVVTQLLVAAGHIGLSLRLFDLQIDKQLLWRATISGVLLVLLGGVVSLVSMHWLLQLSAWSLGAFVVLWLTGMWRMADLREQMPRPQ